MVAGADTLQLPVINGNGNHVVHKMPSNATLGLEDDEDMNFDSPEDEAAYYREKYRRIVEMLEDTRAELDEFQASSRELEEELEKELAATEKQQTELKEKIKRMEVEKEDWKTKYLNLQKMHSSTVSAMQREMDNLRSERDKTLVALRDLEMGNDELERNERVAVSSLLDLESKYNRAIEEKTLLEQEVVQRQEVEEECQRLKDELRDANNEIGILKDQIARSIPTPPSSVNGLPMSPLQELSREFSSGDVRANSPDFAPPTPTAKPLPARPLNLSTSTLTRSSTMSSIPTIASPAAKRLSSLLPPSPSRLPPSSLARSTTSRNLAGAAIPNNYGGNSPVARSRSAASNNGNASPSRQVLMANANANANLAAKTKGFRLLHDLQARLKATDDKLNTKVPKRNPSGPLSLARRVVSNASSTHTVRATSTAKSGLEGGGGGAPLKNPRINTLSKDEGSSGSGSGDGDRSGATFGSPNGWVLVSDNEETPPAAAPFSHQYQLGIHHNEPISPSPMEYHHQHNHQAQNQQQQGTQSRAVSSASAASTSSGRPLPSRPGIPSPLANMNTVNGLSKSTIPGRTRPSTIHHTPNTTATQNSSITHHHRPPSRTVRTNTGATSSSLSQSTRAPSRAESNTTSSSRPTSPSFIPRPSHSAFRAPSPGMLSSGWQSQSGVSSSAASSRPPSRTSAIANTQNRLERGNTLRNHQSQHTNLGRGHPPSTTSTTNAASSIHPHRVLSSSTAHQKHPPSSSTATATATTTMTTPTSTLKRSARRSSLGQTEGQSNLPPTGIPAPITPTPKSAGGGGRPTSVPVFSNTPPPPVPRIPSAHRRDAEARRSAIVTGWAQTPTHERKRSGIGSE